MAVQWVSLRILSLFLAGLLALGMANTVSAGEHEELVSRANAGEVTAQFKLGSIYYASTTDEGRPQGFMEAMKWYFGNDEGLMRSLKVPMPRSAPPVEDTAKWFQSCAPKNHFCKFVLGDLYKQGLGVPKDLVQALQWHLLYGDESQIKATSELMSPEQIAQSKALANNGKPSRSDKINSNTTAVQADARASNAPTVKDSSEQIAPSQATNAGTVANPPSNNKSKIAQNKHSDAKAAALVAAQTKTPAPVTAKTTVKATVKAKNETAVKTTAKTTVKAKNKTEAKVNKTTVGKAKVSKAKVNKTKAIAKVHKDKANKTKAIVQVHKGKANKAKAIAKAIAKAKDAVAKSGKHGQKKSVQKKPTQTIAARTTVEL